MSLISDPDYLIHNLRLTYLRHVDDPYAPRIISLPIRYSSNSHVLAAGLADPDRWPELAIPSSPVPSDDEGSNAKENVQSGFPGATGLKYTQTILGPSRIGALGLRTSGKRASKMKDFSHSHPNRGVQQKRLRSDSEPTPVVSHSMEHLDSLESVDAGDDSSIQVSRRRSAGGSSLSYIPTSFVGTEESVLSPRNLSGSNIQSRLISEGRRIHTRFSSSGEVIFVNGNLKNIDPELSSSSSEFIDDDSDVIESSDGEDLEYLGRSGIDVEDEFDPDIVPSQLGGISDTGSDIISSASLPHYGIPAPSSSISHPTQTLHGTKTKSKLSPVREAQRGKNESATMSPTSNTPDSYFEMVTPLEIKRRNLIREPDKTLRDGGLPQEYVSEEISFQKQLIAPKRDKKSALTEKLASSSSTSSNPFTQLYALIAGRTEETSMLVNIFFPHASKPSGKPIQLKVRKDATVEEVIGFALWSYWEENWLPKLDDGLGTDDVKKAVRLSAVGWVLRIAEEDGEVDEDFPAPDRMAKISKFNFDAYAVLEANTSQVTQNQVLESKIVRRPSRVIVAAKRNLEGATTASAASSGADVSTIPGSSATNSAGLSTSLGLSSSHGPQVLLRIKVADTENVAVHYQTTISMSAGMYMQEALELACRKCKLENPSEWALLVSNPKTLIFLDRTVASLQGKTDLELVRRATLPQLGFHIDGDRRLGRTTDPNASIFKRISEVPEDQYHSERNITAAYKKYTVFRKLPMAVVRLERILAIDGDYIYIIPSASKARAVFDSMKTTPYHIDSVVGCTQSALTSPSFKLIVKRDGGNKRYDFEAESAKLASEIVTCINDLKSNFGRILQS